VKLNSKAATESVAQAPTDGAKITVNVVEEEKNSTTAERIVNLSNRGEEAKAKAPHHRQQRRKQQRKWKRKRRINEQRKWKE
jgi:hypothetical protein